MKYIELFKTLCINYNISLSDEPIAKEIMDFLETQEINSKPELTETGLEILKYLQNNDKTSQKAKDIADGMEISARKISGSIRKLVTDGFVDKFGKSPAAYSLTEKGKNFNIDEYENKGE